MACQQLSIDDLCKRGSLPFSSYLNVNALTCSVRFRTAIILSYVLLKTASLGIKSITVASLFRTSGRFKEANEPAYNRKVTDVGHITSTTVAMAIQFDAD